MAMTSRNEAVQEDDVRAPSVMFMGRRGDEFSNALLNFVKDLSGDVTTVWSDGLGSRLPREVVAWCGDFIVCYRSHIVVPPDLIERAAIAAVNLHPGPPNYRGTGCANFALYDGAHEYGSTSHLLAREIDAGDILDVRRFPIEPADDVASLLRRTHETMLVQAKDVVRRLIAGGRTALEQMLNDCRDERWEGPVGRARDLDDLMQVTADMSADELERRTRATRIGKWRPFVMIDGKKFVLAD